MTSASHSSAAPQPVDEQSRRAQVLKMVRDSGEPRTIIDLADELGVHPNTVRFHLESLANAGRVERVLGVKSGLGRPPVRYRAKAAMDPNGPTNYHLLASVFTAQFADTSANPAEGARALGRAWSKVLVAPPAKKGATATMPRGAAVKHVTAALADLGFAPDPVHAKSKDIRLRHCPFLGLLPDNAEVICSLHLGLMQGAFMTANASVNVDRLDPFVEPDLCIARLAPVGTGPNGPDLAGEK